MTQLLNEKLRALQKNVSGVRNICILAHVDHGKTSLADSLVAANGIISPRMAGRLRYMDSRKDEQERGITMKSSAIGLFYPCDGKEFLINLMDSPGHVDFSNEVSTAVRLCDGAIVVVDVVEGVQPQTKVVLKQAWDEGIKPILVLNKIDRLIVELKYDTLAAYHAISQVLEQVNAVMGELYTVGVMESLGGSKGVENDLEEKTEFGADDVYDWSTGLGDKDDSKIYFAPEAGNVVFASAIDGWAFSLETFAQIFSSKLGFSESVLRKTLWGDYYINLKAKKILRGAAVKAKKPLFVQLVLDNIWAVYEAVVLRKDKEKLEKIVAALSLKVSPRDLRSNDCRQQLVSVFSSWLPLATAVLSMVCKKLPSPDQLGPERSEKLMCSRTKRFDALPAATQNLKQHFLNCSKDDSAPTIVFVSKMFPVDPDQLPQNKAKPLTPEEMAERRAQARLKHQEKMDKIAATEEGAVPINLEQVEKIEKEAAEKLIEKKETTAFIAFARVFSGTLEPGQSIYVLGPKYDPAVTEGKLKEGLSICEEGQTVREASGSYIMKATVGSLYMLLGRELEAVDSVPAGNIVGIGGLENYVLKSATLSSDPMCPPFVELVESSVPILRVAVEPVKSADLGALTSGLQLLNQADAHVQVIVSEAGEQLLVTAGEVHLQRCILDLKESFAKCEISVSEPIVPFRETIVKPPDTDMVNENIEVVKKNEDTEDGEDPSLVKVETINKQSRMTLQAFPLPTNLTNLLEQNSELLKALDRDRSGSSGSLLSSRTMEQINDLRQQISALLDCDPDLRGLGDSIWCVGPRRCGPNILINCVENYSRGSLWSPQPDRSDSRSELDSSVVNGFQLATLAGPLCEESLMGVAMVVREWEVSREGVDKGALSGQVMGNVKDGCRKAFQARPQRLMTAMYSCTIQVRAEVLGKMFGVLSKRGGRVVQEEMIEGSGVFNVVANLPVIESLDFGNELRKQTSGLAMPQLVFSHWETIDIDPFWEPETEEELLHFGDKSDSYNPALRYMNKVRKRKGLKIDEKIVEFAEKQRTITRNK